MKHQYESEILFQLMERDGFNNPSSVPPYEAEIKAYLINQVKLAYPKLTDYEAEWLLYNYTKHLPADFPISSATNVTEATFENVVPFAYQNVVLKGQTIGNTFANLSTLKGEITIAAGSAQFSDSVLKESTIYTISFNCSSVPSTGTIEIRQVNGGTAVKMENKSVVRGYNKFTITSSSSGAERIRFKNDSTSTSDFVFNNLMIIEGDHTNEDNPYFEGVQSVKRPVLTTSNEDGTKTNILMTNEDVTLRSNGDICDELDLLTGKLTQRIGEDGVVLSQEVVKTVDLKTVNESGESVHFIPFEGTMHVQSSGEPIQPTFDMSVPVEATTQNLASFIDLEMEE